MYPSILSASISETILSFRSANTALISSLDKSCGKKSKTLSKFPESIVFLKSVALIPDPGSAAKANPLTLGAFLNVVTLLKSTKSLSPLIPVTDTNSNSGFA